jgi:hypothetical protein
MLNQIFDFLRYLETLCPSWTVFVYDFLFCLSFCVICFVHSFQSILLTHIYQSALFNQTWAFINLYFCIQKQILLFVTNTRSISAWTSFVITRYACFICTHFFCLPTTNPTPAKIICLYISWINMELNNNFHSKMIVCFP